MQALQPASRGPSYEIRASRPTDEGLIYQSWTGSVRAALHFQHDSVEALKFGTATRGLIEEILKRATVRIAAPADDDLTVYGFAVFEPGLLHCVFVKKPLRQLGIGSALLEGTGFSLKGIKGQGDFEASARKHIPLFRYSEAVRDFMDKARKVVSLVTHDSGVEVQSAQGMKVATHIKAGPEVTGLSAFPAMDMEFDPALGGVMVRYKLRGQPTSFLVPNSHIRQMELG